MSTTDPSNPVPLNESAERLLEQIEANGGEWTASYAVIATVCDLARSTAQVAARELVAAGYATAERTPTGTVYRCTDQLYRRVPMACTDAVPMGCTDEAGSVQQDAPTHAPRAHDAPAQSPLPTPIEPSTATRTDGPLASAPAPEAGIPIEAGIPTVTVPTPIGQLAVRAAMEAAREASATVPADVRPRIGHAAQRLAEDEDVETILEAARRLGAGGFTDLYTAVRAVKADRPMPRAVRTAQPAVRTADGKMGRVLARLYGTWPRAQIAEELWEEKLGKVQERFLIGAIDAIAEEGGDFAPTWGKVMQFARRIGEPTMLAERQARRHAAEQERLGPRYPR